MIFPAATSTLTEAGQALLGTLAFAAYVPGPGFLASSGLSAVHTRSRAERMLWSVALGVPVAVLVCTLAGRFLAPGHINWVFAVFDLAAFWRCARLLRRPIGARMLRSRGETRIALALAAIFALFCLAETLDVRIGQRLYISTVLADWSVRVSMVSAAMRSGVPPINGLSTVSVAGLGYAPHLRYYYFWYVLAGQIGRTFGLRAQPALAASCVWAGWGFVAAAFLSLKYMLATRERLRTKCLLLLGVVCVLGLDLLPTLWLWLSRSHHPYPEMEWWHQDRTPSFLGSVLYAPHHIAAWCSLLTGFLILQLHAMRKPGEDPVSLRGTMFAATIAGIAFAAAAGLSLFPTFCFVFVLGFWAVDLIRRRDWLTVSALAGSGMVALLLAHPYLRELSGGSSAASGFANLAWRNDAFVAMQFARTSKLGGHGAFTGFLLRQPVVFTLDLFELGFYGFVLVWAVRRDLLRPGRLSASACAWWSLLLGAALPALFLTSTATSGPNDLGVDAGFLFRFALQLRAVDWVWQHGKRRGGGKAPRQRLTWATAMVLAGLGVGAQIYQVLSIRFYFPLVSSHLVHKQMDALTRDQLGMRLFNIASALRSFDRDVSPSRPDTEAVQFNPVGEMTPAEVYFNDHQIASWDTGCGTSYGGDYSICGPIYSSLLFLYGNTEAGVLRGRAQNDRQDGAAPRVATADDLAAVCRHLKLRAVIAESTDSIWNKPTSWVWTAPLLVANSTVRVVGCPAGSWRK